MVSMAQQSVEMILMRQLSGYLFVPVLIVDADGTVVFYNEPAEAILGRRFEATGSHTAFTTPSGTSARTDRTRSASTPSRCKAMAASAQACTKELRPPIEIQSTIIRRYFIWEVLPMKITDLLREGKLDVTCH